MKALTPVVVMALLILPQHFIAQGDHAPTVQQCQADLNLWRTQLVEYDTAEGERLSAHVPDKSVVMKLTMQQIANRFNEMASCAAVDPDRKREYNDAVDRLVRAHEDRYMFFVKRHRLEDQMIEEDEAGQR